MRYVPLLLVLACDSFSPPNEEVFDPPPIYREWFRAVEACSGHRGDFDRITWVKADLDAHEWLGVTRGQTVYIDRDWVASHHVVAHEQLHILIRDGAHQNPAWVACVL